MTVDEGRIGPRTGPSDIVQIAWAPFLALRSHGRTVA